MEEDNWDSNGTMDLVEYVSCSSGDEWHYLMRLLTPGLSA